MYNDDLNIYKIWAPDDAEWTAWAKPVLFANMLFPRGPAPQVPDVPYGPIERDFRTMVIVDLPGKKSVEESLAFAKKGYRPVPLYNGTMGSGKMLVDVGKIKAALFYGTDMLKSLAFSPDSPPVFMLDANRMTGSRQPGLYDNRWCVFPQDMPSAQYLRSKEIDKIIVRTAYTIQADLERILCEYQKNGIALYAIREESKSPKAFTAKKQSFAEELAYRFRVVLGLRRNATGGFGGKIPDPYESGRSGGHYYRYG